MRLALALILVSVLGAGTVFAQAGSVYVCADPAASSYFLLDQPPAGLKQYYVVHVYTTGATASQYRAKLPACMIQTGAMWLSDTNVYSVTLGNSQNGVAVAYGSCKVGPIHTQTINVFAMGLTPACCRWVVDGDPAVGPVMGADCSFNTFYPTGGQSIVNKNSTCDGTPTEDTTWGHVKALFAE
jgi:hypothetical protein